MCIKPWIFPKRSSFRRTTFDVHVLVKKVRLSLGGGIPVSAIARWILFRKVGANVSDVRIFELTQDVSRVVSRCLPDATSNTFRFRNCVKKVTSKWCVGASAISARHITNRAAHLVQRPICFCVFRTLVQKRASRLNVIGVSLLTHLTQRWMSLQDQHLVSRNCTTWIPMCLDRQEFQPTSPTTNCHPHQQRRWMPAVHLDSKRSWPSRSPCSSVFFSHTHKAVLPCDGARAGGRPKNPAFRSEKRCSCCRVCCTSTQVVTRPQVNPSGLGTGIYSQAKHKTRNLQTVLLLSKCQCQYSGVSWTDTFLAVQDAGPVHWRPRSHSKHLFS